METVLAAMIAGATAIVVAVFSRSDKRAAERGASVDRRLADIEGNLLTNGSKKSVGALIELIYTDVQQTKRDLMDHRLTANAHFTREVKRLQEEE